MLSYAQHPDELLFHDLKVQMAWDALWRWLSGYEDALTKAKMDSSSPLKVMAQLKKTGFFQLILSIETWNF